MTIAPMSDTFSAYRDEIYSWCIFLRRVIIGPDGRRGMGDSGKCEKTGGGHH